MRLELMDVPDRRRERFLMAFVRVGKASQPTPPQPAARTWKGPAMRLNKTQLKQTLNQIDAEVLPENHPAAAQLIDLFGDHTFLLDPSGLKVLEPSETSADDVKTSQVVSLADWSDATLTSLKPH